MRPAWQPGVAQSSYNYTLVRIRTEDGIIGYGGTSGHIARTVKTQVAPYLAGKDVFAAEEHARAFRRAGGLWCVDMALWDILGKAADKPLYKLWGYYSGKVPARCPVPQKNTFRCSEKPGIAKVKKDL